MSLLGEFLDDHQQSEFLNQYWPDRIFYTNGRACAPLAVAKKCGLDLLFKNLLEFEDEHPQQIIEAFDDSLSGGATRVSAKLAKAMFTSRQFSLRFRCLDHNIDYLNKCRIEDENRLRSLFNRSYINGFYSVKGSNGFDHFDGHEVLIFQISGKKSWKLSTSTDAILPNIGWAKGADASALEVNSLDWQKIEKSISPAGEFILEPGDFLFLPRGVFHKTSTIEDSFHLTISIESTTVAEYISQGLMSYLQKDPRFRILVPANRASSIPELIKDIESEKMLHSALEAIKSSQISERESSYRYIWNQRFSIDVLPSSIESSRYIVDFLCQGEKIANLNLDSEQLAILLWIRDRIEGFTSLDFLKIWKEPKYENLNFLSLLPKMQVLHYISSTP